MNWKSVSLGDHCSKIGSGATPRGGSSVYKESGPISLIRSQHIYNDRFKYNGLAYIDEQAGHKLKNVIVEKDDILLNITGDSVARVCQVPEEILPSRVNQHVCIIRPNPTDINPRYLRYFLISPAQQRLLLVLASSGATRNALTKTMIETLDIPKPPIPVQEKIAHILGTLDDKIELNRQMNKTLEAMAQAIFKSWFVDFDPVHAKANAIANGNGNGQDSEAVIQAAMEAICGSNSEINSTLGADPEKLRHLASLFPSEFVESELGLIPKGWEVKDAQEIAMINIGKTPPRKEKQWFSTSTSDMKWISIRDMGKSGVFAFDSAECLTHKSLNKFNVKTVPENTVLLSFKLTLGRVTITTEEMATNEAIAHFTKSKLPASYLYCYLKLFNYESLGSTSSIATAVNSKTIKSMPILNPDQKTTEVFNELVKPLFDNIKNISKESLNLSKLRDTLLPKLLSGELSVENAESKMELV